MTTDDRRNRNVARWPDRRAHAFRSPWPTASMTVCEDCGVRYGDHPATIAHDAEERPEPVARPARVRMFDFDWRVPLWSAYDVIAAALDDEGLALSDANTRGDSAYSVMVTVDGRAVRRVIVPPTRIVRRG